MPRIEPLTVETAEGRSQKLLTEVEKGSGRVPNIIGTMAHSSAVLHSYLSFSGAIKSGSLSNELRECVAMTVAGINECSYCAAAHHAIGQSQGQSSEDLRSCLRGESKDAKTQAALDFSRQIIETKGFVSDEQFKTIRDAGFSEGEVLELVATVSLNTFTNYINHVVETEIDFPPVD